MMTNQFNVNPVTLPIFPPSSIWIILCLALFSRLVGIGFGIPFIFGNVDEYVPVSNGVSFLETKSLQPVHFNYPALYFYTLSASYVGWFLVGLAIGSFSSSLDFALLFITHPGYFHLVGRIVTALLGTASVFLIYRMGEKISGNDVGIISATLLAFSPLHVELSHWALPDVPMTFLFTLAFLWTLKINEYPTVRHYFFVGILAGSAIATKYNAALITVPILLVHARQVIQRGERWLSKKTILAIVGLTTTFFLLNPFWVLEFGKAFRAFSFESTHMAIGHIGQEGMKFVWPLLQLVEKERIAGVIFLFGMFSLFTWKDRWIAAVFGSTIFVSLLYVGSWSKASLHYLLFLFPLLCVVAAVTLQSALNRITTSPFKRRIVALVGLVVLIAPQVLVIGLDDISMSTVDTREEAKNWIDTNVPKGETIAYVSREGIPPLIDSVGIYFDGPRKKKFVELLDARSSQLKERIQHFREKIPTYHLYQAKQDARQPKFPLSWQSKIDTSDLYIRALFSIHWASMAELRQAGVRYALVSSYDLDPLNQSTIEGENPLSYLAIEGKRFFSEITDLKFATLIREWRPEGLQRGPSIKLFQFLGAPEPQNSRTINSASSNLNGVQTNAKGS